MSRDSEIKRLVIDAQITVQRMYLLYGKGATVAALAEAIKMVSREDMEEAVKKTKSEKERDQ